MKIDKRNPAHWLLLVQQAAYALLAIAIRPFTRRPKKPVVILYGHQLSGNLKALYLEWEHSHADAFSLHFLSLDTAYAEQLANDGIHVLRCSKLRDMLQLARTSAIVTDHGLHAMAPLVFLTDIVFVDVWHGIPFKGFTPEDFRLQQRYDEVWVSSPLLKEIYQSKFGFKPGIVRAAGYARTDKLFQRRLPDPAFRTQMAIPDGQRIVLYAPTWQQDDKGRALFPFGESQSAFIQRLGQVCHDHSAILVIRSHLNASISAKNVAGVLYCSMKEYPDTESLLQHTDILVCDWSSIAFDFLALDRPTIFLDVAPPFKNSFSLDKKYRFGKVVSNMEMLCESLALTLEDATSYYSEQGYLHREITAAVYGHNTDGNVASRQLARLAELTGKS
jgi:CDP-glycerol glycerophosphotransferase (TagB/SpsB family)